MIAVTAVSKPTCLTLGFRATDALGAGGAMIVLDTMVIGEDSSGDAAGPDSNPKSVTTTHGVKGRQIHTRRWKSKDFEWTETLTATEYVSDSEVKGTDQTKAFAVLNLYLASSCSIADSRLLELATLRPNFYPHSGLVTYSSFHSASE